MVGLLLRCGGAVLRRGVSGGALLVSAGPGAEVPCWAEVELCDGGDGVKELFPGGDGVEVVFLGGEGADMVCLGGAGVDVDLSGGFDILGGIPWILIF